MQTATVHSCCCPVPSPSHSYHLPPRRLSPDFQIRRRNTATTQYAVATRCSEKQVKKKNKRDPQTPFHNRNRPYPAELYSFKANPATDEIEGHKESRAAEAAEANMWWADLMAAVGQRVNLEGVMRSAAVVTRDRHLALPHVAVPDIRFIDWEELRRKGFRGVVFDKDNTITAPYSLTLWGPIRPSIEHCKSVFGNDIAIFSNSAGLHQYDPDGVKAGALERATGIKVARHRVKKPSGTSEEIEKHFGCASSLLVMVGDRHFTDIVYGNRNGFLTILTEPLTLFEEPFIVKQLRRLEVWLVKGWSKKGVKPTRHRLLADPMQCVKDSRLL